MKRVLAFGVVAVLLGGLSGCGASHDSIMKDMIKDMNEAADVLEGVKDEDSLKEAKPKLEKIAKHMQELGEKAKKLGDPSKEEQEKLLKKHGEDLLKAGMRLAAAQAKIKSISGADEILKDLQKAGSSMGK